MRRYALFRRTLQHPKTLEFCSWDTICFAVVAFSLSAALSLFFIHRIKALSHFHRLSITRRTDRMPHSTIPRTGGVAIAIAVALSLLILAMFSPELCHFICSRFWIVLLASFIIFVTGLVDDFYGLHFTHKLVMQVVATALVVYGGGYRFDALYLPFLKHSLVLHDWSSVGLTFIWIIGLCNAVNLADGLDGLAGGASAIGFFVMLVSVLGSGYLVLALVYAVFLGAILGFLRHNFYPASIYMGLVHYLSALCLRALLLFPIERIALPLPCSLFWRWHFPFSIHSFHCCGGCLLGSILFLQTGCIFIIA